MTVTILPTRLRWLKRLEKETSCVNHCETGGFDCRQTGGFSRMDLDTVAEHGEAVPLCDEGEATNSAGSRDSCTRAAEAAESEKRSLSETLCPRDMWNGAGTAGMRTRIKC